MTNEQLAVYLQGIQNRLLDAKKKVIASAPDDLIQESTGTLAHKSLHLPLIDPFDDVIAELEGAINTLVDEP